MTLKQSAVYSSAVSLVPSPLSPVPCLTAAHIVQWDNPDETNRVVRAFLQSADSTKAKP